MIKFFDIFDEFISNFSVKDITDFWYDDSLFIAQEFLEKFTDDDWDLLIKVIDDKPIFWKYRLAELLGNNNNFKEFEVLMKLVNTNDEQLFEISIDALRFFKNEEFKDILKNNFEIFNKIKNLYFKSDTVRKKIFDDFLDLI